MVTSDQRSSGQPQISVVIPAHNAERYIGSAIESVLNQTVANVELIVVNDGSTDATESRIQEFSDPRVRCITQINQGPSAARNAGLTHCTGKYVAFLDADDIWLPQRLQRQLDTIAREGVQAVFSWIGVIDENGTPVEDSPLLEWFNRECPTQAEMIRNFFFMGNFLCASAGLIETELLNSVGGFCLTAIQAQDFHMWIKLAKKTRIAVLPEPLVRYRVLRDSSITHDSANAARIRFENQQNYRTLFMEIPEQLFRDAFPSRKRKASHSSTEHLGLEKAFLYLEHSESYIRYIGLEMLYTLMQDPQVVDVAQSVYNFTLPDVFALTRDSAATDIVTGYEEELKQLKAWAASLQEAVHYWRHIAEQQQETHPEKIVRKLRSLAKRAAMFH